IFLSNHLKIVIFAIRKTTIRVRVGEIGAELIKADVVASPSEKSGNRINTKYYAEDKIDRYTHLGR
ncbi:MAG: hypothetical protein K2J15_06410, partial [Muribaculaceae bacterium]|nr:hypothetical protein [Muribaculaceae bacterium]